MTTENNKIIAEFMGLNKTKMFFNLKSGNYVKKETVDCDIKAVDVYLKNNKPITNFYYHSDWNWLMEVIEKILNICAENDDLEKYAVITDNIPYIQQTYDECIKFINFYNKQKEE